MCMCVCVCACVRVRVHSLQEEAERGQKKFNPFAKVQTKINMIMDFYLENPEEFHKFREHVGEGDGSIWGFFEALFIALFWVAEMLEKRKKDAEAWRHGDSVKDFVSKNSRGVATPLMSLQQRVGCFFSIACKVDCSTGKSFDIPNGGRELQIEEHNQRCEAASKMRLELEKQLHEKIIHDFEKTNARRKKVALSFSRRRDFVPNLTFHSQRANVRQPGYNVCLCLRRPNLDLCVDSRRESRRTW